MRNISLGLMVSLILSLSHRPIAAQQAFKATTGIYSSIIGGKRIAKDSVWDEINTLPISDQWVALGFTFQAFGHSFDTIWLDQAGFWDLSEEVFVGLWADLCDKGKGSKMPKSPILVGHEGIAGNRIVKIEWQNFGFVGDYAQNGNCSDSGNIQIWIYESPQKIEMYFGKSHIAFATKDFPDGVIVTCSSDNGAGATDGIDLSGNPANPITKAYNPASQATLTSFPAENTVYTFTFGTGNSSNMVNPLPVKIKNTLVICTSVSDITVMDLQGRIVTQSNAISEISLAQLPPAVYVLNCKNAKENITLKLLVSN